MICAQVKPTTWLCFMTILSFFIVCARFEVFGQLTSYVPAMSATRRPFQGPFDVDAGAASTPSIDVVCFHFSRRTASSAFCSSSSSPTPCTGSGRTRATQCNPRMRGMEWGLVVLVFVLLWGLGPYTLYYTNIMLCVFVRNQLLLLRKRERVLKRSRTDHRRASLPPRSAALETC